MDSSLKSVAVVGLNSLRKNAAADSTTCHFFNPYSEVYWLFHKDGDFDYECQLSGPLTHPDQNARFDYSADSLSQGEGFEIAIFDPLPAQIKGNVLAGESFATRERIISAVRIRLFDPSDKDRPQAFIFLNYRSMLKTITAESINTLKAQLSMLQECLTKLADQPRLSPETAWRLRGVNLNFRQRLGDSLLGQGSKQDQARDELYALIVSQAMRLFQTRLGNAILCTLSVVDVENNVATVAKALFDKKTKKTTVSKPEKGEVDLAKGGIVEFVSRTGQLYFINDVGAYKQKRKRVGNKASLPNYVEWDPRSKCELACPLIVQGKVAGVINIEADAVGAFDEEHVLLLHHFSTTAALVVRQASLWNDLNEAIRHQHRLLGSKSENDIFDRTVEAVAQLGYVSPSIWNTKTQQWHHTPDYKERRNPPRADGFTNWILKHGKPVALADLRTTTANQVDFEWYVGTLDKDSRFFESWHASNQEMPSHSANSEVIAIVISKNEVYTDLGFPIFSNELGEEHVVCAVLWAKCRRYFRSLLNDEAWCLSLLCRNAVEALKVSLSLYKAVGEPRRVALAHRFGERRVPAILDLLERDRELLSAKPADDVIVLHIDIRGSRELEGCLLRARQQDKYSDFIRDYHEGVRTHLIEHGGVFDKTMGDGIQGIFNVYRREILPIESLDNIEQSKGSAVKCAVAVFGFFTKLLERYRLNIFHATLPDGLCLGAGLAIGPGYLGSFSSPSSVPGFEYSIHGEAGNQAGTLVGLARGQILAHRIDEKYRKNSANVLRVVTGSAGTRSQLTHEEVSRLVHEVSVPGRSLLLMAPQIASGHLPKDLEYYMFDAGGGSFSILTWSP